MEVHNHRNDFLLFLGKQEKMNEIIQEEIETRRLRKKPISIPTMKSEGEE